MLGVSKDKVVKQIVKVGQRGKGCQGDPLVLSADPQEAACMCDALAGTRGEEGGREREI